MVIRKQGTIKIEKTELSYFSFRNVNQAWTTTLSIQEINHQKS